jgi:hypothetical protein
MRIPVCESKREQQKETSQPPRLHKANNGSLVSAYFQVSLRSARVSGDVYPDVVKVIEVRKQGYGAL